MWWVTEYPNIIGRRLKRLNVTDKLLPAAGWSLVKDAEKCLKGEDLEDVIL